MTCLKPTLPVPATEPAALTLPQPLMSRALLEIEHAVAGTLGMLRRDQCGLGSGAAPAPAARRREAADIEYASWIPDAGAIEFASWTAHLLTSRR